MSGMSENYVVETYCAELTTARTQWRAASVAAVAGQIRAEGHRVALLGRLLVPDDEVCFWRFIGSSAGAVEAVSRRAGLDVQRIGRSLDIVANEPLAGNPQGRRTARR